MISFSATMRGFERYRIVRLIKRGGAADVFEAAVEGEMGFERRVAIKRLRREVHADESFVKSFIDEANIVSQLHHANIVSIFDFGISEELPFQVLEYVDGCDLLELDAAARSEGVEISAAVALWIAGEIAHGLEYAHGAKDRQGRSMRIVHRDITPENVLLSWNGEVKVADFGIALATRRLESTHAGLAKGKLPYMAPEQMRGDDVDHRADVFALGCVLHRLLAGRSPIEQDSERLSVWAGGTTPIDPALDEDLAAIVRAATKSSAQDRYANVGRFAADCGRALAKRVEGGDVRAELRALLATLRARIRTEEEKEIPELFELILDAPSDEIRRFSTAARRLPTVRSGPEREETTAVVRERSSSRGLVREAEELPTDPPEPDAPDDESGLISVLDEPMRDPLLGAMLGTYRLEELIGEGGTSRVYRAVHPVLNRSLTIKVLTAKGENPARMQRRFEREAQALARIQHPNIIGIVDFGTTPSGLMYLVMEHAPGRTLADLIDQESPLPLERTKHLARQLAAGLAEIHRSGLVHRDLKPQNVIVLEHDVAKIVDFGIVRVAEDTDALTALTRGIDFLGTPAFMAPEQMRAPATVGAAADLYSLGAILYSMLAGAAPYSGDPIAIVRKRLAGQEPPGLPECGGLERLVEMLMREDPRARPASAAAVLELLTPPMARPRSRAIEAVIFASIVTAGLLVSTAVASIILRKNVEPPPAINAPPPAVVIEREPFVPAEPVVPVEPLEPERPPVREREAKRRERPAAIDLRAELKATLDRSAISEREIRDLDALAPLFAELERAIAANDAAKTKQHLADLGARLADRDVETQLLDQRLARIRARIKELPEAGRDPINEEYLELRTARERADRAADRRDLLRRTRDFERRLDAL